MIQNSTNIKKINDKQLESNIKKINDKQLESN